MNIIEWNIGYGAQPEKIMEVLRENMNDTFIFMILEVIPNTYEQFLDMIGDTAHVEYSLNYRKPGKYDGKNRKLGVMIITSNDIDVLEVGVFNRTLYPDRTLYETIRIKGKELKIVALHSITGCSHLVSKSNNFRSFAEAVDEFKPDIVSMDANEPEIDHFEIKNMKFFEKNGNGARLFYETLDELGLKDSIIFNYDTNGYTKGKPLAVSHMINGKKPVRYDFIFVSNKLDVKDTCYDYEKAKHATADHAIVSVCC